MKTRVLSLGLLLLFSACSPPLSPPPSTKKVEVKDTLHGVELTDPLSSDQTTRVDILSLSPAALTAPAALDFHDRLGPANKAARLRYLRDRWVSAVRGLPDVEILTPDELGRVGGMTSFRLNGTSTAHNQRLIETLRDRYRLFTARRTGMARGDCVSVTPALFNSAADVDRLAAAIGELSRA